MSHNGLNHNGVSPQTLLRQIVNVQQSSGDFLTDSQISDTAYDATSWNGVTDVAPSKNAVRDKIEALAFSDLDGQIAVTQLGASTGFPNSVCFATASVDFNSGNTDTTVTITLPTGFTRYQVGGVRIYNATGTLTTVTFGMFTATGGGGTAVVTSGTACTVNTSSADTANNSQNAGANNSATLTYSIATVPALYFRVQTPQGSAATASVALTIVPLP